jgi:hypothetical protein
VGWDHGIGAARSLAREVVGAAAPAAASAAAHAPADPLTRAALPELAQAAARYVPKFGSMSVDDVARGRALVQDALDGLQVVPVVNRWWSEGLPPTIVHGDALLGTVHTLPPRHVGDQLMRVVRRRWELARHMHGPGELAGSTVFASAQFVPRPMLARHGGDVVAAVEELARTRGSRGVARFGDRAHVLDPTVLERATASGRDSGLGLSPARIAPMERLDDVVLERLARSHGFQRDPFTGANEYRIGVDGAGSAAARRESLRRLLHATPHDESVARLRSYLTSETMTDIDHMVELQVRGVREREVLATAEEAAAAHVRPVGF